MPQFDCMKVSRSQGEVTVTLNRPEVRNAFHPPLIVELTSIFQSLGKDESVRLIVLAGEGRIFCAGMDLKWLADMQEGSEVQRLQSAEHLMHMFQVIEECPCPVVARVQGGAYGGGVGLVAACDVAIATEEAQFALREVRIGLAPAVIAPLLVRKLGLSTTLPHCLSGQEFDALTARRLGLVHEVVPADSLDRHVYLFSRAVREAAPQAVRHTKALLRQIVGLPEHEQWSLGVQLNARLVGGMEAKEGVRAFTEKRRPQWMTDVANVRVGMP